jgi:hypothetical protein
VLLKERRRTCTERSLVCASNQGWKTSSGGSSRGKRIPFETEQVAGFVTSYTYRMDADPNDFFIAAVFESREAYWANAQRPEQDARYRKWLPLLEGEPEWHDGEIDVMYAQQQPAQR